MKKGTTVLAESIAFVFLIITGYVLTGTIMFTYGAAVTQQWLSSNDKLEYKMTLTAGYFPVQNEIALLSILESDCSSDQCIEISKPLVLANGLNNDVILPGVKKLKVSDAPPCVTIIEGYKSDGTWSNWLASDEWIYPGETYNIHTNSECLWPGQRIPVKKIVTECLIQDTDSPDIYGINIIAEDVIESALLWGAETYSVFIIKEDGTTIHLAGYKIDDIIAESGKIKFQKVSSKIFTPFETGSLEMYVFE